MVSTCAQRKDIFSIISVQISELKNCDSLTHNKKLEIRMKDCSEFLQIFIPE